jgi:hypothetical protein
VIQAQPETGKRWATGHFLALLIRLGKTFRNLNLDLANGSKTCFAGTASSHCNDAYSDQKNRGAS